MNCNERDTNKFFINRIRNNKKPFHHLIKVKRDELRSILIHPTVANLIKDHKSHKHSFFPSPMRDLRHLTQDPPILLL